MQSHFHDDEAKASLPQVRVWLLTGTLAEIVYLRCFPNSGVFCRKCCGTKQYLEYEGIKNLKKERVCDGCIMAPAVAAVKRTTRKKTND